MNIKFKNFVFILILLNIFNNNNAFGCDFSQTDKIKHIKYSKKSTIATKKVFDTALLPIKPIKWIFNDKIQLIFPDNYIPHILSGTLVFTGGFLKETWDVVFPGDASYCDLAADCRGIKEGILEKK